MLMATLEATKSKVSTVEKQLYPTLTSFKFDSRLLGLLPTGTW